MSANKILIVEDDNAIREYLATALTEAGVVFDEAEHGRKAVELALANDYDVIFMDIEMPFLDGIEATQQIRQAKGPHWPPRIVAMTARDYSMTAVTLAVSGFDDFVQKPFTNEELLAKLG
jgi:DNA-binding response OmpR family regulator